eukprot:GHVQ01027445.1.p1 GENE.GHVQ01027445.1~~GHVQ01027445.1.p1  ORF type:complete len:480 (+),score=53.98 GHVQ01027445.1:771-2210(+)
MSTVTGGGWCRLYEGWRRRVCGGSGMWGMMRGGEKSQRFGFGLFEGVQSQQRWVRVGMFRSDKEFVDPENVLFSESQDEWRFADDGYMKQPVLERNNVGMGMLILRNLHDSSLSLPSINLLYRKLRNLEVNTLKKFVCLTSFNRDRFCTGLSLTDILLLAESSQIVGALQPLALEIFRNQYELSWLIHTYYKPLVILMNGDTVNSGAALCCLANRSAAYKHSTFTCNATSFGWFPDGGLSHVLSGLRGSLGMYLALTGHMLTGPDLIWSDMCRHWVSPEAFKFMELTGEKHLEVSEADSRALVDEHSLPVEENYSLKDWESIIHETFDQPSLTDVINRLQTSTYRMYGTIDNTQRWNRWAKDTYARIQRQSPMAAHVTHHLLRSLRKYRHELLREADIDPFDWNFMKSNQRRLPLTQKEASRAVVREAVEERCLRHALTLELRIASRLLMEPDCLEGLKAYLVDGTAFGGRPEWTRRVR